MPAPLAVAAQQAGKIARIGILSPTRPIAALAVLALANGCATCSSDDLTNRAGWGAPVAVVDQAGFVYRGDVFPSAPWGIPSVRTWGVPCRLPESARSTARPCTPAEMADPDGPVCYIWRYVP